MFKKATLISIGAVGSTQALDLATTWELFKPWKYPQANNQESQGEEDLELKYKFQTYIATFGKQYATKDELEFRMQLFNEVDQFIENWNNQEKKTHMVGHNEFSDWTDEERDRLTGVKGMEKVQRKEAALTDQVSVGPQSVNWIDQGAVNPVQNQGLCGSCWAFSAIGAVEAAHFIKTKELVKLSEQQCVDCDKESQGCNGGLQANCFEYAMMDNLVTEKEYPYTGIADSCFSPFTGKIKVTNYTNVQKNSVQALKMAIAQQPVSVTVSAGTYPFQHYMKGIITDQSCGKTLDHAILAVGYGTDNGQDYYLVKNSWGNKWGEAGYVRIGMVDGPGICGIQEMSLYPTTN